MTVLPAVTGPSDIDGINKLVRIECAEDRRECPNGRGGSGVSIKADSERSCAICAGG